MPEHLPENSPLDNLHIASPCHASWDAMTGDDKARFCKTCQKNVFNLSLMTRTEAESLILAKEGNLCVRFSQREDGTVLTQDCPVGFERAKMQALRPWRAFAAGIAGIVAAVCGSLGIATPAFAQPPIDIPQKTRVVKGDMAGAPAVQPSAARMGEPVVCSKPGTNAVTTQGRPVAVVQGGISAPPPIMGKPATAPVRVAPPVMGMPAAGPPPTPTATVVVEKPQPTTCVTPPKAVAPVKTVSKSIKNVLKPTAPRVKPKK